MTAEQEWAPCRPGEISGLASRQRRDRFQAALVRVSSLTAVGVLFVGTAAAWFLFPKTYTYGGITCEECIGLAPAYVANEIEDPAVERSVRIHFEKCPLCGPHLEDFRQQVKTAWLQPEFFVAGR